MSITGPVTDPGSGEPAALVVEHVSKQYTPLSLPLPGRRRKQAFSALTDVSLRVGKGEMVGVLGPNGAGKTTLLKIITTLIYPSAGRVTIDGIDIGTNPLRARGRLGLVTCDERSFYWRLTGRQNLEFFGRLYGLDRALTRRRSDELLDMLGLSHAADRSYQKYSSGMRQKLAIARGLLGDPQLIFYDEPTRSLDPLSAQSIRQWIHEKRQRSPGQTHIIATNQLHEAEQLCDRVFIINRGRLIAQGSIEEIRRLYPLRAYQNHQLRYSGGGPPPLAALAGIDGMAEVRHEQAGDAESILHLRTIQGGRALSSALELLLASGAVISSAHTEQVSLDDVFCSLVDPVIPPDRAAGQES